MQVPVVPGAIFVATISIPAQRSRPFPSLEGRPPSHTRHYSIPASLKLKYACGLASCREPMIT